MWCLLRNPQAATAQLPALLSPFVPLALTSNITTVLSSPFSPKSTEQVTAFCRSLHEMNPSDCSAPPQDCAGPQLSTMRQLTDADKLRKVICELLETERTYVKVRASALLQSSPALSSATPGCTSRLDLLVNLDLDLNLVILELDLK